MENIIPMNLSFFPQLGKAFSVCISLQYLPVKSTSPHHSLLTKPWRHMWTFPSYSTRHLIDLSSFIAPVLCFPQESLLACPYRILAEFWSTCLVWISKACTLDSGKLEGELSCLACLPGKDNPFLWLIVW